MKNIYKPTNILANHIKALNIAANDALKVFVLK